MLFYCFRFQSTGHPVQQQFVHGEVEAGKSRRDEDPDQPGKHLIELKFDSFEHFVHDCYFQIVTKNVGRFFLNHTILLLNYSIDVLLLENQYMNAIE
jgi:hypothetical protein